MKHSLTLATLMVAGFAANAQANDKVTVEFAYPYSHLFDVTYKSIMPKFKDQHPNIEIKFRATYENYEDGTNTILREAVSGNLPDVTMQGLNRQAILVEKGIAKAVKALSKDAGPEAAEAIMTTDTRPKHCTARVYVDDQPVTITGLAKGAGMIEPNMATTPSSLSGMARRMA